MGLSAAMEIGKNGLKIYQIATEVTGENIANVNTPGYSRQRVILENAPPTTSNGFPLGTGVKISTVERYYDGLLQQQLVNAQTTLGYDTTKSNVLQQIEPTFNEVTNDGLGAAITNFFSAWQDLTLNPTGSAERTNVMSRAQILTDNFHAVNTTLANAVTTQNDSLVPLTDSINATLKNIAQLNQQIKTTELVSGNANEMRDQRDQLIRDLSQQIGITYTENSDGTTDINYKDGGAALVTGGTAGSFSLTTNSSTGLYDVNVTPPGGAATLVSPTTGQLGATLTLRDTIIPGYQAKVDALANAIATQVNAAHNSGYDLNGDAGKDFFTGTTAATITLNTADITGVDKIAASGSATLPGDNSNALALAQLQNKNIMSGSTATFGSYFNGLVSQIGLDVQSSKNTVAQDTTFTNQLMTLRESNSGVSLDEELTNLVKYQRSYQASAKLITTATEMMDTVIAMIR
ncbi:flagellar hook-associated protein FlgK [Geobacter sp. SVR]|uniref:flagellar hook-associated protein FlgK n=1 Tax=Geobacter sp. SVR TaxID=2495594 RepID=UPI00143F00ED|nr:flagellar hook-associated protein FlgK [Geobacter sp. SVR]BCS55799.1 flagellar hook-associated protein 1 [Geobacter sp. SVR]GCF83803.1 flagellar hook-associated protein 1 [Geobacter sp. SVR]